MHREYFPVTGHFIQPDPLGYTAGDVEVYGWCLDDPVNLVDPLGLEAEGFGGKSPLKYYWKVFPNEGACDECQALAVGVHWKKPERPHPNCKCIIRKYSLAVSFGGTLEGYDARESHTFSTGQSIDVTIINMGATFGGVNVFVDGEGQSTGHLRPGGGSTTLHFTKFCELPVPWDVELAAAGADNCLFHYTIQGGK